MTKSRKSNKEVELQFNILDKKGNVLWTSDFNEKFVRTFVEMRGGSKLTNFEWELFKDFVTVMGDVII
jgi:hypothetical protein